MSDATTRTGPRDAEITALFQEIILDHYRRPRNKGTIEDADEHVRLRKSPTCGDKIGLDVRLDGDRLAEVRFVGEGCSISQASASMMTQAVKGKTLDEARGMFQQFHKLVHGEPADEKSLGELRALAGVSRFPARMQCALLAWGALYEVLERRK